VTPTETLIAAAERLESLDAGATTARDGWGYYNVPDGRAEMCTGPMQDGYRVGAACAWEEEDDGKRLSQCDGDLIATLRPVAAPLAAHLRDVAQHITDAHEAEPGAQPGDITDLTAVAVARAILGYAA